MALGMCELLWIRKVLGEVGLTNNNPIMLYCDNKAVISITNNLVQHNRTKHIEIDRPFIKEKLTIRQLCIPFVQSKNQLMNVFTKALTKTTFHEIIAKIGMEDIHEPS